MKADIASVVSLLTQQPRVLQKHPRLLVTIRKRILGQIPAVGTRGAMQIYSNKPCAKISDGKFVLCGILGPNHNSYDTITEDCLRN